MITKHGSQNNINKIDEAIRLMAPGLGFMFKEGRSYKEILNIMEVLTDVILERKSSELEREKILDGCIKHLLLKK